MVVGGRLVDQRGKVSDGITGYEAYRIALV